MMRKRVYLIIQIMIILILSSCTSKIDRPNSDDDTVSSATLERYQENELMEYEGIHLDPAIGPRDNSINGIQEVDITTYSLKIDGLVENKISYTYDQILEMDSLEVVYTIYCVEGWDATFLWKGVLMKDVLDESNVLDDAKTVIFHAVDGYTTSLPLDEIIDNDLMIAYNVNGLPIPSSLGYPFIFVAYDKWGYKWARWINRIELSADTDYMGYWESRGYDNNGDIPKE
jgi:DMSO/TMAO reductase YedYZ molybdopterin-dependent catalytic subunit